MRAPAVSFIQKIAVAACAALVTFALVPIDAFAEGEGASESDADSTSVILSEAAESGGVEESNTGQASEAGDAVGSTKGPTSNPSTLASGLAGKPGNFINSDVALDGEPVIGSFTVDGLTFAVIDESHVELVGISSERQQVTNSQEGGDSGVAPMLASGSDGVEADASTLVLPESISYEGVGYTLTSIAPYAFYLSGVADVTLPASVSDVDDRAFRSSDVANVTVAEGNPIYSSFDGALYDAEHLSLLLIPEGKQGAVLLPKTAEVAEASVFSHCPLVDSISVEKDGAAFASENGLLYTSDLTTLLRVPAGATEITIREGCTTIAAGALEACANLTTINAPASVTSISPDVFHAVPTVSLPAASVTLSGATEAAEVEESNEHQASTASDQLTAMVALSSVDDNLPQVEPTAISFNLSAGFDASPWQAVGFSVEETQGDAEVNGSAVESEPDLPVASLGSASTYAGAYDFTIVNAEGSTLYQTNSSGSTNTAIDSRVISCGDSSHQVHVRFLSKGGSLIVQLWHSATSDNSYYRWVKPGYVLVGVKVTNGAGTISDEIRATEVGTSYKGASQIKGAGRTISPIFEKVTYTVPLDKDGGTGGSDNVANVQYGSAMPSITPPTKAGYAFMGYYWSANGGGTQYYDQSGKNAHVWDRCVQYPESLATSVTLSSSYRLVAYWLPAITFDGNGGSVERRNYINSTSSAVLASGTSMVLGSSYYRTHAPNYNLWVYAQDPPHGGQDYVNATRMGYTFAGWATSRTGSALEKVEKTVSISSSITFYALWTPNKYTVSFKANGGSGGQTANATATYDSAMPAISTAVPVRVGYRFMGYYDNVNYAASGAKQYYTANRTSARSYDKTANCTLYAGWKQMPTITFDGNGGTVQRKAKADNSVLQSGASFGVSSDYYKTHTPNANLWVFSKESPILSEDYMCATRTGYTWQGWATSKNGTPLPKESKTVNVTSNIGLYAQWSANAYTVKLEHQGGSNGTTQVKPTYGSAMPAITIPVREGYAFRGYYTAPNGGGTQYYTWSGSSARNWDIAGNQTLYAKWTKVGPSAAVHVPNKSIWRLYGFDGSYRENEPIEYKFDMWDLGKNRFHSMRFYNDSVEVDGLAKASDGSITGRQFGYKLGLNSNIAGVSSVWVVATQVDGGHKAFKLGDSSSWMDIANYAHVDIYLDECVKYAVTWDPNGGEVEPRRTEGVLPYASVPDAPRPTREGYVFIGWFDAAIGGNYVCGSEGTTSQIAGDTTFYAHWTNEGPYVKMHSPSTINTYECYQSYSEDDRKGPMSKPSPYTAGMMANDIRLNDGTFQMYGAFTWRDGDGWIDAGITPEAKGVTSVWVVAENQAGEKTGFALGNDWLSLLAYKTVEVYFNNCVSYTVTWDANGGEVNPTVSKGILPQTSVEAPMPTSSATWRGYAFVGWYTDSDEGELVCGGGKQTPPIVGDVTYYAHWVPALAADAPLGVTVRVDLLGVEDQEMVPDDSGDCGYLESRSAGRLEVSQIDFEPLDGANGLFGADATSVFLEVLPDDSIEADVRFSLAAAGSEIDAIALEPFVLPDGFGTRIPISYRFDIPPDVLAAIDPARFEQVTTSVCSVVYTVALAQPTSDFQES